MLDFGPTEPPSPVFGKQIQKKLSQARSCAPGVLEQARAWAQAHNLGPNVLYSSPNAADIELLPEREWRSPGEHYQGLVERFEALRDLDTECARLEEKYAKDPARNGRPPRCGRGSMLDGPDALRPQDLVDLGFSPEFATSWVRRLARANEKVARAELQAKESIYDGITYIRVTYSYRPRTEYTITTGTGADYELSTEQLQLIATLEAQIDAATNRCIN